MSMDMNDMMRRAGNRSRALPDIGQGGAPPRPPMSPPQMPMATGLPPTQGTPQPAMMPQMQPAPAPAPQPAQNDPLAAPGSGNLGVNPQNPLGVHPPGTAAPVDQYNYEPQPDGAWKVYPPGVPAPPNNMHVSTPRAASTNDYARMRQTLSQGQKPLGSF